MIIKKVILYLFILLVFVQSAFGTPINIVGLESGDTGECRSLTGTTPVIESTTIRSGSYSLKTSSATTAVSNCRLSGFSTAGNNTTDWNVATLYSRFYWRFTALPSTEEDFFVVLDTGASQKAAFTLNSAGHIKARNNADSVDATGTATLSANTWYKIEISVTTGSGDTAYTVKVDGTTDISDSMNTLTNNVGSVRLGKVTDRNGSGMTYFWDDLAFDDASYPPSGAIKRMYPDADGSTQNYTSGTNSSNYLEVDEVPTDGDTTYVAGTTSGTALFNLISTSTAGISGTIYSVKALVRFREAVDGSATTSVRVRSSSTNSNSATNDIGTAYVNRFRLLATDPATGSAWTTSGLDSVEVGINEATASQSNRLTTVMLFVDYLDSGSPTNTPTPTNTATFTPTTTNTPTSTPTSTPTPTNTPTLTPIAIRLLPLTGVGQ